MGNIRQMCEEDIEAVALIEAQSFGAWQKKVSGQSSPLLLRTQTNIRACREKDPQGCLVAEVDGALVGFIFSRTWGKVGWFGTFAVLPEFQAGGIGKQLIEGSLDYLRGVGVRLIGLETMVDSPYNLGLYLKRGFRSRLLTFLLTKSLDKTSSAVKLPCWSQAESMRQESWTAELRNASMQIQPGFDYTNEILLTGRLGQGETLVLGDGASALGMSTILLKSQRRSFGDERAIVACLALHPDRTSADAFRRLLLASESLAQAHGKQLLTIPVNARHNWALQRLLVWGYTVERAMVRMTLQSMEEEPLIDELVNCSRWAG